MRERRGLDRAEMQDMAELMQFHALAGLMEARRWETGDVVFHGGSSLHFAHGSSRRSEDLDFLMRHRSTDELHRVMEDVRAYVAEALYLDYDGDVELKLAKDRANNPVLSYTLGWSRGDRYGKVKVKVEFMRADIEHMIAYRAHLRDMRVPTGRVQVSPMIPTADAESVVADKVVALAFRPYIKERDFFDLWWLIEQHGCARPSDDARAFCERLDTTLAIYGQDRASFGEAVEAGFAELDLDAVSEAIAANIPQWLPDSMNHQLEQRGEYRRIAASVVATMQDAAQACCGEPAVEPVPPESETRP